MNISDRLVALRREMECENIDIYIVPTDDYHQSEYVGEFFKCRQFISGFTGSAGIAAVTLDKAGLWTDGRYFIQAEHELSGSGITLYRSGEPGVDTLDEFLEKELPEGGVIGFDGRTAGVNTGKRFAMAAIKKNGTVSYRKDLIGRIWTDRPGLPEEKVWLLEEKYSGESCTSKLERVRQKMKESSADVHLLSSLDDIAWLLNIRGGDIAYCPLVLSYLLLFEDHAELFADADKFPENVREELGKNNVILKPYDGIYAAVSSLPSGITILIDPERVNYTLYKSIPEGTGIIEKENPEVMMKCMKNDIEISNIRNAHIKDAVAHTRFMYWLKTAFAADGQCADSVIKDPQSAAPFTEISVSDKLEAFRAEEEGYLGASFAPISAFGSHGAIVHYSASPASDAVLTKGKMLLTDTGGHYREGSTDITRTVALGEISTKEKEDFTLVARAMLRLMNTVFLHGCSGANLDCIAREVFWKERVNFNHGTGHGVGYLLNVHEAPVNFRWKEGTTPAPALERNMIISDEPGIYIEGSHGIRLENILLVCEDGENEYGRFMHFEPLTYVPIDLDALLPERMTAEERNMLNCYHSEVYKNVSPYLNEEERIWLKQYTRPV